MGRTEDEVRDEAKEILGFNSTEEGIKQGTGQTTKFNKLGFKGVKKAPDGWYLPENINEVAIVLETKGETENIEGVKEKIFEDIDIMSVKYKKIVGIIWNGKDIKVFKNKEEIETPRTLQHKQYYLDLFKNDYIDKSKIYSLTKKINNLLHFKFGIKNLYHRMIFTACTLVAKRYGALLIDGMDYTLLHNSILNTLNKSLEDSKSQNKKLNKLTEIFSSIQTNIVSNQNDINNFIKYVKEISDNINSNNWNGEDVMGIFFNEFNRYKGKSENGQVFTPDNITSLMYRILEINCDDVVFDGACGSGAFLVKAMSNMIKEAGGINSNKTKSILTKQLYGIEWDSQIYALACANMLIHKDGKSNLEQLDTRYEDAYKWINSKKITKVLMNPPYEAKYGCIDIITNVLNAVPRGIDCAFILPDKKLNKVKKAFKILKEHSLLKIIKLPEKTFFNEAITTSIFIFKAGVPQNNKEIFTCYIEDDGLETVKNQGRQDTKGKWKGIEDYWVEIIKKQSGDKTIKWIKPNYSELNYPKDKLEFKIDKNDFKETIFKYELFENNIDVKELEKNITEHIFYNRKLNSFENNIMKYYENNKIEAENNDIDYSMWKEFSLNDVSLFDIVASEKKFAKKDLYLEDEKSEETYPYITTKGKDNGVAGYSDFYTEFGNVITIDSATVGNAFYQPENFICSEHIEKLVPKFNMDKYIALFIVTILNKNINIYSYAYDEKRSKEALAKEKILLPVTKNGDIDFEYMRNFIKSLEDNILNKLYKKS